MYWYVNSYVLSEKKELSEITIKYLNFNIIFYNPY